MKQLMKAYRPGGFIYDLPASEVNEDYYTYGENIVFQDGSARVTYNNAFMTESLITNPYKIQSVRLPTNYYWLFMSENGAGVVDNSGVSDISPVVPFTGGGIGDWTSTSINNIPVVANGFDAPHYWDLVAPNPLAPLPNFPADTVPHWVGTFKGFCIVGDIDSVGQRFENQILWSDPVEPGAVPNNWTPAPDNLAGDNILASSEGAIIFGLTLRDQYLLFKTHATYSMRFAGGVNVFNFQELFTTVGILSRNCAVEYKGFAYIFTDGDLMVTDGFTIDSIAERQVRSQIFLEMNNDAFNACFVCNFRFKDEIWFCYPTGANVQCNRAAVYNVHSQAWGFMNLDNLTDAQSGLTIDIDVDFTNWLDLPYPTWNDWSGTWTKGDLRNIADGLIQADNVAATGGRLRYTGQTEPENNPIITSILQRESLPLDDPDKIKTISEVWLNIDGYIDQEIDVRLGTQAQFDSPISWGTFAPFDVNLNKADVFAEGRFISLEIRIRSGSSRNLRIHGFRFRYRYGGRF